jgi:hippurate hydrolase
MTLESIIDDAKALLPDIVELRRALHRNPEVGLELPGTRTLVLEAIADLPLEVIEHETTGGIVAVLRGESDGPTVLLRGDMDGLPLREDTGLEYSSVTGDTMHACGHDLHTAMLVGAARLLSKRRSEIAGAVMFMFQPGEEGFAGARFMLDEGMLDAAGKRPELALAIHVTTILESGVIAGRAGPMMASADQLNIVVSGAGGHASKPDAAKDPVAAAAEIIMSVQSAVTRNISAFDPVVCTFTAVEAGNAHNIIPDQVTLRGTIRALSTDTRAQMHELVARVADGVSAAHGMTARTSFEHGYPVTVNDPKAAAELMLTAQALVGSGRMAHLQDPAMGAEDFSYVLEEVPGAMFFLGACPPDLTPETSPFNHSNLVRFDEEAMVTGIAFHAAVALGRLG